ncbi:orotidine-5'-phosphate decarboxylase [Egicoccus halophilus]|uniref:Orotidine 5'-phosphate decarboxylase n=1 Tax=Egicoccus halophilus TaxID=1670830 RepID=A0A8J3A966_9ACTN|nr:orotidine-5'-phosphate decarboxylase [Egicoccus halophilus]GGI07407.1 orotidine 5'-phosphate decarboxylase [Egicoccus halophilus]
MTAAEHAAAAGTATAPADRIAVALDVPTLDEARALAGTLSGHVGWFKVGLELFSAHGPSAVEAIAAYGPVFLDVKLHDIPTTVERAAARIAELGVGLLTVHAAGGRDMVRAAVSGLGDAGRVLAVTVLTSMSDLDLQSIAAPAARTQVPSLASLAVQAGAPGLVCAPKDLVAVRRTVGDDVLLVTPGIRPAGSGDDDHARAATPARALADGADLLVVGRPITRADDPAAAADAVAAGLTGA